MHVPLTALSVAMTRYVIWSAIREICEILRSERSNAVAMRTCVGSQLNVTKDTNEKYWIILNNFHRFQDFRQCSNLFSQNWLKSDGRHSFLEFVAKCGQIFIRIKDTNEKYWIILNNFHRFQNFRQCSNLFSQIWSKKRYTSLFSGMCREIRTKIHQTFAEKNAKFELFAIELI